MWRRRPHKPLASSAIGRFTRGFMWCSSSGGYRVRRPPPHPVCQWDRLGPPAGNFWMEWWALGNSCRTYYSFAVLVFWRKKTSAPETEKRTKSVVTRHVFRSQNAQKCVARLGAQDRAVEIIALPRSIAGLRKRGGRGRKMMVVKMEGNGRGWGMWPHRRLLDAPVRSSNLSTRASWLGYIPIMHLARVRHIFCPMSCSSLFAG